MSKYIATVKHSSISSHYSIDVSDNLVVAKRQAAKEFGGGFVDHKIVIVDADTRQEVTSRRVGGGQWSR